MFLLAGAIFLPWWLTALFVLILIMLIDRFYEAAAAGFFFDALYGAPPLWSFRFPLLATVLVLVLVRLLEAGKKRVIFYRGR